MFINGNLDGSKYFDEIICGTNFLDQVDSVFGFNNWFFQHDNTRPHVRKDVIDGMKNLNMKILKWPFYSPGINVIETIWGIMKIRVLQKIPNLLMS